MHSQWDVPNVYRIRSRQQIPAVTMPRTPCLPSRFQPKRFPSAAGSAHLLAKGLSLDDAPCAATVSDDLAPDDTLPVPCLNKKEPTEILGGLRDMVRNTPMRP